jgi:hypothetical protein
VVAGLWHVLICFAPARHVAANSARSEAAKRNQNHSKNRQPRSPIEDLARRRIFLHSGFSCSEKIQKINMLGWLAQILHLSSTQR